MISAETLAEAIETRVITPEQAQRMRALELQRAQSGAESVDDEHIRFASGFGDIFVALGLTLFLSAAGYFLFSLGGAILMWPGVAILAWALAEFFTRVRRMALPSILLLVTFVVASFSAAHIAIGSLGIGETGELVSRYPWSSPWVFLGDPLRNAGAGVAAAMLAALHYWRFGVPITIAAGVASLACAALALVRAAFPALNPGAISFAALLIGLAIFSLAMRYDLSDPERATRRTDIAFWLHLVAAPLIVHPLVASLFGGGTEPPSTAALGILAIFLALGFVAVLIDRRALLVSGLSYAGLAFASLLKESGVIGATAPATMLVLGAFVLLLSAGWRPLRAAILNLAPRWISSQLPRPSPSQNT